MAVADALLLEAQLPLQVLDDGVLGALDVRVGGEPRGPGDRRLPLGECSAEGDTQPPGPQLVWQEYRVHLVD